MPTSTFSAAPINSDATTFRAWGKGISDALAATGMIKTTDTGQIDWATVAAPGGVTTYMGYEIWRFNDTLQATAPLFIKLEYGSGASTLTNIGLRVTIGKGSDGAGTITGVIQAAFAISQTSSFASARTWYVSTADGSQVVITNATSSSAPWTILVERSRNPAGAATSTGLIFVYQMSTSTGPVHKAYNYATAAVSPVNHTAWPASVPVVTGAVGLAAGGRGPMFPAVTSDGAGNFWQPRSVLTYAPNDATPLIAITVPGWGVYLPLSAAFAPGWANGFQTGSWPPAIAWY